MTIDEIERVLLRHVRVTKNQYIPNPATNSMSVDLDSIREAAAALAALHGAWQPIETAPKDGNRFLAFEPRGEYQRYECWWQDDFSNWSGWQTDWDNEPNPTHWQPLPPPPAS